MSTDQKSLRSITELPNELSRDIDLASPGGIVKLLRQSDAQIAVGYSTYPALLDPEMLDRIEACIEALVDVLRSKGKRRVIISGAGTSGRLATVVCREFNRHLKAHGQEPVFSHLMAGGSPALIKAKEGAEDDPHQAVVELKPLLEGVDRGMLFGVTCGFSAPYIAGQLEYCMNDERLSGVLLGFNPVERARDADVENWDKTFHQVAMRMVDHPRAFFLNPVVGPEPITGSTRMKGGSATKLLLEIVIGLALIRSGLIPKETYQLPFSPEDPIETLWTFIQEYEKVRVEVYRQPNEIARLVKMGGEALRREGHIYYVGQDTSGILGLIDASECPPTFGADFGDVRGFLDGGWMTLLGPGEDISHVGPEYRITIEEFEEKILPEVGSADLVCGLGYGGGSVWLDGPLGKAKAQGARIAKVLINPGSPTGIALDGAVGIELDPVGFFETNKAFGEYATKLVINALTTGAHVLSGKVYENRMVDLKISNNKLFYRTLGIIQDLMGVDVDTARRSLVCSIFATDEPTREQLEAKISAYVDKATLAKRIVPRALLLATGRFNIEQAGQALHEEPIVRVLVDKYAAKDK